MFILRADAVCDVCLDPYTEDKSPAVIRCGQCRLPRASYDPAQPPFPGANCSPGHVFCRPCLHTLASRNCPICRAFFSPAEITRVHIDFQPDVSTPPPVVERLHEEVDLEQRAVITAKTGDVRQMASVLARLKSWSISVPFTSTQPPAIRAVADLLELLMEATTQLNDALEQFSGEERRNTLQSRIREHEWAMEKRELLKERGALREQLELQKDLHTLAEEKLRRVQAAATGAPTTMSAVRPPTPQRSTSPSWFPSLPPVANVSAIPITFPDLSPKSPDPAQLHEIKAPSPPTPTERAESPKPVESLQPITNLPLSPVSPFEIVSRRRVRPATADSATSRATNGGTTGSAPAPPVLQAATLIASTGEHPNRSRTMIRGPRAQSSSTLVPPRNLPIGPTSKTHTNINTSASASATTVPTRSSTPAAPSSTVQSDREAALQTLTSAVTLLSSAQRHSTQPASHPRPWGSGLGTSHPPSSMPHLVASPPRRESLRQRAARAHSASRQENHLQPQSQAHSHSHSHSHSQTHSQAVANHIRAPRPQQATSPPPSFPDGLARRVAVRRSSREIVI